MGQAGVSIITRRPNALIVAHELSWASTRSRLIPPLCSIRNKSLQQDIQSSASGCSSFALIADMKLNVKRTLFTRMRMVVVVALMNLIAMTYLRASTTCMTRISSRPRRWWTRVTSTNEVVWVLYDTFGIIWYYMAQSAKNPIIQTHSYELREWRFWPSSSIKLWQMCTNHTKMAKSKNSPDLKAENCPFL